jgi:hypothetical protein
MPPPTMSISGRTPSNSGDTGPPVFGRADAEGVALAVELAVAVALMLADELLLADALGLDVAEADALGLIIAEADALGLDMALAEDEALDMALVEDEALDMAEDEALDIMDIVLSSPICCAIATAANANTATRHRAANKRNFLKIPPSVDLPLPGSTCTFPRGSMIGRPQSHRQCACQDPVGTDESVGASKFGRWGALRAPAKPLRTAPSASESYPSAASILLAACPVLVM